MSARAFNGASSLKHILMEPNSVLCMYELHFFYLFTEECLLCAGVSKGISQGAAFQQHSTVLQGGYNAIPHGCSMLNM
uniref:Uncharacterized protein n=1 Tax=Aegilops tauschii subsp. strangulata TaxID=200361 RepID=A0A453H4N9_AEGTS